MIRMTYDPARHPADLPPGYLALCAIPPLSVRSDHLTGLLADLHLPYTAVDNGYSIKDVPTLTPTQALAAAYPVGERPANQLPVPLPADARLVVHRVSEDEALPQSPLAQHPVAQAALRGEPGQVLPGAVVLAFEHDQTDQPISVPVGTIALVTPTGATAPELRVRTLTTLVDQLPEFGQRAVREELRTIPDHYRHGLNLTQPDGLNHLIHQFFEVANATRPVGRPEALFVPWRRVEILTNIKIIMREHFGAQYMEYFASDPVTADSALWTMVQKDATQKITDMLDDLRRRTAALATTGTTEADRRDLTAAFSRLNHFADGYANVLPLRAYRAFFHQLYDDLVPAMKALPAADAAA